MIIISVQTINIYSPSNHITSAYKNNSSLTENKTFDQKIKILMYFAHMPSLAVCVINNDSVWSKGYKESDRENNILAANDTIYMVGSISKTFTATAILQLYEQGKIDLDDDISNVAGFPIRNPRYPNQTITFRMLLSHRASLGRSLVRIFMYFSILGYPNAWLKELLQPSGRLYSPQVWLNYSPGEMYYYSDLGFILLGYLVERISGQPFEEYCTQHIFLPLDMTNTGYFLGDFPLEKLAVPYIWIGGAFIPLPHYHIGCFAAGGLRISVLDLSHFLIAHMNNGVYNNTRILKNETIALMHTRQFENEYYCLGWMNWTDPDNITYSGHDGAIIGGRAQMWYRESDHIGIIYFSNQFEFIRIIILDIYEKVPRPIVKFAQQEIENMLWEKAQGINDG